MLLQATTRIYHYRQAYRTHILSMNSTVAENSKIAAVHRQSKLSRLAYAMLQLTSVEPYGSRHRWRTYVQLHYGHIESSREAQPQVRHAPLLLWIHSPSINIKITAAEHPDRKSQERWSPPPMEISCKPALTPEKEMAETWRENEKQKGEGNINEWRTVAPAQWERLSKPECRCHSES